MHVPSRSSLTSLSRRASLISLGAAGLSTAIAPLAATAKKKKGDVNKRCKPQVDQCEASLNALCGGDPECAAALGCCESLGTCDFSSFAVCLAANR